MSRARLAALVAVPCVLAAWIPATSGANRVDRLGFLLAGVLVGFGLARLGVAPPRSARVARATSAGAAPALSPAPAPTPDPPVARPVGAPAHPSTADLLAEPPSPAPAVAPAAAEDGPVVPGVPATDLLLEGSGTPEPVAGSAQAPEDVAEVAPAEVVVDVAADGVDGAIVPVPVEASEPDVVPEPDVAPAEDPALLVQQRLARSALAGAFAGAVGARPLADVEATSEPARAVPEAAAPEVPPAVVGVVVPDEAPTVAAGTPADDTEAPRPARTPSAAQGKGKGKATAKSGSTTRAGGTANGRKTAASPSSRSSSGKRPSRAAATAAPPEPVVVEPVVVESVVVESVVVGPVAALAPVQPVGADEPVPSAVAAATRDDDVVATVEQLLAARLAVRAPTFDNLFTVAASAAPSSAAPAPTPPAAPPAELAPRREGGPSAPTRSTARSLPALDEGLPSSSIVERLARRAVAAGGATAWSIGRDQDDDAPPAWALAATPDATRRATEEAVRESLGLAPRDPSTDDA